VNKISRQCFKSVCGGSDLAEVEDRRLVPPFFGRIKVKYIWPQMLAISGSAAGIELKHEVRERVTPLVSPSRLVRNWTPRGHAHFTVTGTVKRCVRHRELGIEIDDRIEGSVPGERAAYAHSFRKYEA
jgi:hypothetical protein